MAKSSFTAALQTGRAFGVRGGMLRLQYELQRGTGLMNWKMRPARGWAAWDLPRIAPQNTADSVLSSRLAGAVPFFFKDVRQLRPLLARIDAPQSNQSICAEADRILAGHLPFFGSLSYDCGFPPRWFENPVTGQKVSPEQSWTQMRFASPTYGDLKFILEPSRFLFVYPLARAYARTADERFPQGFWRSLEDWSLHNPPMEGPLWICGQECSLRIPAWSFALHSFLDSPSTTPGRVSMLLSMIAAHAWRTRQTLGYARSQRSNHLITEAVGLWTAGTLFPELQEAPSWKKLGAELLHEAVLDQITPEGVSHQHSFNYQRMILDLLLWTLRLSEIHNAPLHPDIRLRAESAFDFLRTWVDPQSGSAPNYGSNDGSLILPLASASYRDDRPLLQLGASVLARPPIAPGPWDEAPLWFGLEPKPANQPVPAPGVSADGYFRLGDSHCWAMIRAGAYARRPFQADQLHVDLWRKGVNLARDPGTYLYNGPSPWDNGFAGTAVHNTVMVDGEDQMRRAGRFLWLDWAEACGKVIPEANRFEGSHSGYARLGVSHRRWVQWLPECGWVIVDDLEGAGQHDLRLHWLTADLPFEVSHSPFCVTMQSQQSPIRWQIVSSAPGSSAIIRAGKTIMSSQKKNRPHSTELLGWEAFTYGDLRPALSLVHSTRSSLPVRFVTVLLTHEECEVQQMDREILILRSNWLQGAPREATERLRKQLSEMFRVSLA
jgi:asparagine synthase (glutamine-hydrolysing)